MSVAAKYVLHALFSFGTNLLITYGLHDLAGWSTELAFAIAQTALFLGNFWIARHLVFGSVSDGIVRQFRSYATTSLSFRVGEYLFFLLLLHIVGIDYMAAAAVSLAVSFSLKFVTYRTFVFKG